MKRVCRRHRIQKTLRRLAELSPVNVHAIAFILTEQAFRGPLFRFAELVFAAGCIFVLRRDPMITMGYCQVSFAYWRRRYGNRNIELLFSTMRLTASYRVCCDFIEACKDTSTMGLVVDYCGRPTALYVSLFLDNLDAVQGCAKSLNLPVR